MATARGTGLVLRDEAAILLGEVDLRFAEADKSLPREEDKPASPRLA